MCQPLLAALGSLGLAMNEARSPSRWQTSLTIVRKLTAMSAIVMGSPGAKVNSNWLGPISISTLRTGMPITCAARRSVSRSASDLAIAGLGQILVPLVERTRRRRAGRHGGVGVLARRIDDLEDLELHFESHDRPQSPFG